MSLRDGMRPFCLTFFYAPWAHRNVVLQLDRLEGFTAAIQLSCQLQPHRTTLEQHSPIGRHSTKPIIIVKFSHPLSTFLEPTSRPTKAMSFRLECRRHHNCRSQICLAGASDLRNKACCERPESRKVQRQLVRLKTLPGELSNTRETSMNTGGRRRSRIVNIVDSRASRWQWANQSEVCPSMRIGVKKPIM